MLFFMILSIVGAPALAQTKGDAVATTDRPKNNWAVNCNAAQTTDAPLVCQMVQNVIVAETKQRLLTIAIRPVKDVVNHRLTVVLPHGVDFSKGVEVSIDDKEALNVSVQTSDAQGAYANLPISDELLANLKVGVSAKFSFQSMSGKTFAVPISLIGFSSAYAKLSAS